MLATTGLLLGGDEVDLEVVVGPAARLELVDVAGTVAYHGRGRPARWSLRIQVAAGAQLRYRGEPFVVAAGADVLRELTIELAADAVLLLRDTLVLGRSGESPGRVRAVTRLDRGSTSLLVEDLVVESDGVARPGLLGEHRVVDTVVAVGAGPPPTEGGPAQTFQLLDPDATMTRFLGRSLADSPLQAHPL